MCTVHFLSGRSPCLELEHTIETRIGLWRLSDPGSRKICLSHAESIEENKFMARLSSSISQPGKRISVGLFAKNFVECSPLLSLLLDSLLIRRFVDYQGRWVAFPLLDISSPITTALPGLKQQT